MGYTYEYFQKSADYVKKLVPYTPEVAIVLGSALGSFADKIEDPIIIEYKDIPNFLVSTVASHAGKLIFGTVAGFSPTARRCRPVRVRVSTKEATRAISIAR